MKQSGVRAPDSTVWLIQLAGRSRRACRTLIVCLILAGQPCGSFAQPGTEYDALIQRGNAQLQARTADQALATGEQAIKMDTTRWEGYALAGGALMNLKRYEEATDRLSAAIERAPQDKQTGLRELRRQCLAAESGSQPTPSGAPVQPSATESTTTQAEIVLWKSIENSKNRVDFETYLSQYPNGAFAALAKAHLNEIEAVEESSEPIGARAQTAIKVKGVMGVPLATGFITPKYPMNAAEKDEGATEIDGKKVVFLSPGDIANLKKGEKVEAADLVELDQVDGQKALGFWVNDTEGICWDCKMIGRIYVTAERVVFKEDRVKLDFSCSRSSTTIKARDEKDDGLFDIYDDKGQRHSFAGVKFDSPYIKFLQKAISDFPGAYAQIEQVVTAAQTSQGGGNP